MSNNNIVQIGTALKWRNTYDEKRKYYQENVVTLHGCVFRCKTLVSVGEPPVSINDKGHLEYINTDVWDVVVDMAYYFNTISDSEQVIEGTFEHISNLELEVQDCSDAIEDIIEIVHALESGVKGDFAVDGTLYAQKGLNTLGNIDSLGSINTKKGLTINNNLTLSENSLKVKSGKLSVEAEEGIDILTSTRFLDGISTVELEFAHSVGDTTSYSTIGTDEKDLFFDLIGGLGITTGSGDIDLFATTYIYGELYCQDNVYIDCELRVCETAWIPRIQFEKTYLHEVGLFFDGDSVDSAGGFSVGEEGAVNNSYINLLTDTRVAYDIMGGDFDGDLNDWGSFAWQINSYGQATFQSVQTTNLIVNHISSPTATSPITITAPNIQITGEISADSLSSAEGYIDYLQADNGASIDGDVYMNGYFDCSSITTFYDTVTFEEQTLFKMAVEVIDTLTMIGSASDIIFQNDNKLRFGDTYLYKNGLFFSDGSLSDGFTIGEENHANNTFLNLVSDVRVYETIQGYDWRKSKRTWSIEEDGSGSWQNIHAENECTVKQLITTPALKFQNDNKSALLYLIADGSLLINSSYKDLHIYTPNGKTIFNNSVNFYCGAIFQDLTRFTNGINVTGNICDNGILNLTSDSSTPPALCIYNIEDNQYETGIYFYQTDSNGDLEANTPHIYCRAGNELVFEGTSGIYFEISGDIAIDGYAHIDNLTVYDELCLEGTLNFTTGSTLTVYGSLLLTCLSMGDLNIEAVVNIYDDLYGQYADFERLACERINCTALLAGEAIEIGGASIYWDNQAKELVCTSKINFK